MTPEAILEAAGGRVLPAPEPKPEPKPVHEHGADGGLAPPGSDEAIALAFTAEHAGRLLYVAAWNRWLRWDGTRWREDDTLAVFDLVRGICRRAGLMSAAYKENTGKAAASAKTVAAVERLARADRRHARRADAFDADPWMLNTPGGIVDLRTGRMRPHRPTDLVTKVTAVAPGGDCPTWRRFIGEATGGDTALAGYLQRWAGYCLTGSVQEHAFAFLHGRGMNGKSVWLNAIAAMLGDYATTALMDTFVVSRGDRHPTELAALRGARMVVASETEEGRPWAEAKLKSITGGDPISARVMRGDPFEFRPAFKLMIAGNHRPPLRNPDEAMRRRLHLVPFLHRPARPDPDLPEKLKAEYGGILTWAIAGCLEWQRIGLAPPPAVTDATNEYFQAQDRIGEWLAERAEERPGAATGSSVLFADWKRWADARNETPGSQMRFCEAMARRFAKRRTTAGMQFQGVALLPSETGAWLGCCRSDTDPTM